MNRVNRCFLEPDTISLVTHLIDLEPFRRGDDASRRTVAQLIDDACSDTGFLHVVGHGVPEYLLEEMLDVSAQFFDLPLDVKAQFVDPVVANNRGYAAEGSEALAYSLSDEAVAAPDLFEAFNVGREDTVGPYFDQFRSFYSANVWPDQPEALIDVWQRYMAAIRDVNDTLLEAFALALGLGPGHLLERTRRAVLTMRVINYQRRAGAAEPVAGQLRMGPHTDYGVLTVLLADPVPGLEIRRDGQWQSVVPQEGAFLVNLGDMLSTWTNDRWVSTLHRVVPPPVSETGSFRRRSVAQFLEADPGCVIECLPSCLDPGEVPKYEPIEAGEYLLAKLLGPRELRRSDIAT
ncbi:MAG: isopenicillin N synthase-like dioxygenase [Candidatus Poriferisodalaceae bacterium]|jgi:isopenicillin N synthase-like dioxygenase